MAGARLQLPDRTMRAWDTKAAALPTGPILLPSKKPAELTLSGLEQSNGAYKARIAALEAELRTMRGHIRSTLTLVQAMAVQTRRHTSTPAEFQQAFGKQIVELARANGRLTDTDRHDATLRDVINGALHIYSGDEPRCISVVGPIVLLSAELAVTVGLCLHELVTNAVKHGALSVPAGRVDVYWDAGRKHKGTPKLDIRWRERGGPAVKPPRRLGFGSQLLKRGMPPGGTVKLEFSPEGVQCRLRLPLSGATTRRRDMEVRQCMTADVRLASPRASIQEAAHMMREADTGALPVGENNRLVGMITDRDIAIRAVAEGRSADTPVQDVMSNDVQCCFDDEELDSVAQKMGKLKVRRLPVLNRDKRLVGMISLGDLAQHGDGSQGAAVLGWVSQPHGPHKHA